jgi:hypothetical protein
VLKIVYVPIFFAESANANIIYLNMLEMWLWPQLREDFPSCLLFQQDRSPPHHHFKVKRFLDEQQPRSWIGQGDSTLWLPWSSDLTTMDLFIWGISETMHMHHICHNPWNRYSDKFQMHPLRLMHLYYSTLGWNAFKVWTRTASPLPFLFSVFFKMLSFLMRIYPFYIDSY